MWWYFESTACEASKPCKRNWSSLTGVFRCIVSFWFYSLTFSISCLSWQLYWSLMVLLIFPLITVIKLPLFNQHSGRKSQPHHVVQQWITTGVEMFPSSWHTSCRFMVGVIKKKTQVRMSQSCGTSVLSVMTEFSVTRVTSLHCFGSLMSVLRSAWRVRATQWRPVVMLAAENLIKLLL